MSSRSIERRHLGLDLGGTNLKWAVVAHRDATWTTLATGQVPTRIVAAPDDAPAAIVDQLADVAGTATAAYGPIDSVGIGVPGRFDSATGATRFLVNVPGPWAGQPVAVPVAAATGVPAFLINDARAFGLAELRLGAGRGAISMIGLTLGTGIGGVVAIDGAVIQGHDGAAGEIGHQTIDPDGPLCRCGNRGCLEAHARADQIAAACGTATAAAAFSAARGGDKRAIAGLAEVGRLLGIGIANVITIFTPDRVVVGGGIAAAADLLFPAIRAELERRVRMTALDRVELVVAELGTWAGAIGAAVHGAETLGARRADALSAMDPPGDVPAAPGR